jgi:hypothetical protein
VKLPVAELPRLSADEHATVVAPNGNVEPEAGLHTTARAPSTTSVAVTENVTVVPPALGVDTLIGAGRDSAGPAVSDTVTVNDDVPVLPFASVAEHRTGVAPKPKALPEAGAHVAEIEPLTRSVAAGTAKVTVAPDAPVASTLRFGSAATVGAVVSVTVTENWDVPAFPWASVAEHVTVVMPTGNAEPDAGAHATASVTSTMSLADGVEKVTIAPEGPVASADWFATIPTTGAVVSMTVIVNDADALRPTLSVAVHVIVVAPIGNVAPDA